MRHATLAWAAMRLYPEGEQQEKQTARNLETETKGAHPPTGVVPPPWRQQGEIIPVTISPSYKNEEGPVTTISL